MIESTTNSRHGPRSQSGRVGSGPQRDVTQRRFEAFRQGLRELGYVEGQSIILEPQWAEGKYDRYPALAADLVRLKVDVIVTPGGAATQAAQQATRTIPIVMSLVLDPVASGLVQSLAHPGGNVTGTSMMAPDLVGKQLQLLKEALFGTRLTRGVHPSCARRKVSLEPWRFDSKPWRRGTLRRSTAPSGR